VTARPKSRRVSMAGCESGDWPGPAAP
jgi:hypothetical protein